MCRPRKRESIAILMGCRDGARFLPEQLASIAAQSHRRWRLFASDDGSTDATRAILADFAAAHPGQVEIREGPARRLRRQLSRASPVIRRSAPTGTPSPTRTTSGIPSGWRAASRTLRRPPRRGPAPLRRAHGADRRGRARDRPLAPLPYRARLRQRAGAEHRRRQHHAVQPGDEGRSWSGCGRRRSWRTTGGSTSWSAVPGGGWSTTPSPRCATASTGRT